MQGASRRLATAFHDDLDIQAELHRIFAMTYINLGMLPEGRQELDEAQRHIDALRSNPAEKALLEFSSGTLDYCQHHLDEAERKLRKSSASLSRTEKAQSEPYHYAMGLNNLAVVLSERGKFEKPNRRCEARLRFWGNPQKLRPGDIALLENNLGLFELQNGRLERAQAELRSAIDRFHGIPEPPIQLSAAEVNLAVVERLQGHPQATRAAWSERVTWRFGLLVQAIPISVPFRSSWRISAVWTEIRRERKRSCEIFCNRLARRNEALTDLVFCWRWAKSLPWPATPRKQNRCCASF